MIDLNNLHNPLTDFSKEEHYKCSYSNNRAYLNPNELSDITTKVDEFIEEFQVKVPDEDRESSSRRLRSIISITGDDKVIAGTNVYYTCAQIAISDYIFKTKLISKHDTCVSHRLCNYTEGYIMHAPNRNATYDSTNRRFQGNGMPVVFDTLKIKQFLPNSKGNFDRVDLSDKMEHAFKQTEWTNSDWIGKPYAELMKVIMLSTFDFREARSFPMLYKTEGGCGGTPPFDNLDTFKCALYYFRGGKCKEGIAKIMQECSLIQSGAMSPGKGTASQLMHLAQTGTNLANIRNFITSKSKLSVKERHELINALQDKEDIPKELIDKSYLVAPEDKLTGALVSELRSEGVIMTELDVRVALVTRKKFEALLGDIPMGIILKEMEEKKKKERAFPTKLLMDSINLDDEELMFGHIKDIAMAYFVMRKDRADITGLSYAGTLNLFKSEDVKRILQGESFNLADDFILSLPTRNDFKINQKYGRSIARHERIRESLTKGLKYTLEEVPEGICSDDCRIAMTIRKLDQKTNLFIISDDKRLKEVAGILHPKTVPVAVRDYFNTQDLITQQIERENYLKVEKTTLENDRKYGPLVSNARWAGMKSAEYFEVGSEKIGGVTIFTCHKGNPVGFLQNREIINLLGERALVMYDYANINRQYEKHRGKRGYFPYKEAQTKAYFTLPWDEFKELQCFQYLDTENVLRSKPRRIN